MKFNGKNGFKLYDNEYTLVSNTIINNTNNNEVTTTKFSLIGVITCFTTLLLVILFKDYFISILVYLDTISKNYILVNILLFILFMLVSLPFIWGYSLCLLTVSYIYDFYYGFILSVLYSSIGVVISFYVCRYFIANRCNKFAAVNIRNKYLDAIISCIEGKNGFKIILLSRIIPLPFGLTNLVYSLTKINFLNYIFATVIGLVPTQLLTCYIGAKLKSINDVITYSNKTAQKAYYIFAIQIIISFVLMYFLIKMAKLELNKHIINSNTSSISESITDNENDLKNSIIIMNSDCNRNHSITSNSHVIKTNELVN